jgi:hypothetical protein
MRFSSFAFAAALLLLTAGPACAGQLPPKNSLQTYNFKGNIKFHGPFKAGPHTRSAHRR